MGASRPRVGPRRALSHVLTDPDQRVHGSAARSFRGTRSSRCGPLDRAPEALRGWRRWLAMPTCVLQLTDFDAAPAESGRKPEQHQIEGNDAALVERAE